MMEQPLRSVPITEMVMSEMDAQYKTRILFYMRHELHCKVEPLEGKAGYYIQFPPGTREETYPGQSTQWNHRTTLRFPTGQTLARCISINVRDSKRSTTLLAFPNTILDGPEPPEE